MALAKPPDQRARDPGPESEAARGGNNFEIIFRYSFDHLILYHYVHFQRFIIG